MTNRIQRCWMLKTVSNKNRSYLSHSGYDDILESKYSYDNNVANSQQVSSGDLVILVDKEKILGYAKISRIKKYPDTKTISRCPNCGNTNYEARKTKLLVYRCNKGHEFDIPTSDEVIIEKFEAYYGNSFLLSSSTISIDTLKPYFDKGYNRNMSIQSLDINYMDKELINKLKSGVSYPSPLDSESWNEDSESYSPNEQDSRVIINRQISSRRGQQKFRSALLEKYNSKCCVTGCSIVHLLEAAHIKPYRGEKDNHISNGLLLRTDIHTLFDLDMIGIHPEKLTIHINDEIRKDKYEDLEGLVLNGKPSRKALRIKWDLFLKNK